MKEHKEVINLGNLGHYITQIEDIFAQDELNVSEQQLVLQQTMVRVDMKIRQMQADNLIDRNPFIKLAKKFIPKEEN